MAIAMQGSWTVKVKSKEAGATPQRFVISGAVTGNGTYDGTTATPDVHVTGDAWSLSVQYNPGGGFRDSFDQIAFPTRSGGQYKFDVQANDDDIDPVFDDLILTCSTPVTIDDFVIYGNLSWYRGCWYNPCSPPFYFVIDSQIALANALARPALRTVIEQLYPARVFPPNPNPPDPGPFQPMLLPVDGAPRLPARQAQLFEDTATKASTAKNVTTTAALKSRIVTATSPALANKVSVSSAVLTPIRELYRLCQSGPLPQYVLRFQEYDRTAAELAGGAYTGTGPRRTLGVAATDRHGNYVFRFTMGLADFLDEAFNDTASGEDILAQIMPDIIVQVLEGSNVIYETAPYWNIPNFDRINVCVPWGVVHEAPGCKEGQIVQSIGNITVGPLVGGIRTTSNTFLGTTGEITSFSSLGPTVRCGAWAGSLYLYACLNAPDVVTYTISYKRPGQPDLSAQFVADDYSPYHAAPAPLYWVQQSVGPTTRTLVIDGTTRNVPSYFNIETDPAGGWMDRWKLLKVQIASATCQANLGGPGPIEFRIIGFRANGSQVASDRITLYVDNSGVDRLIDQTVKMLTSGGTVSQGDCALFTADPPNAPLEIAFRANQSQGFMDSYTLYMYKGAGHPWAIEQVGGGQFSGSYVHGDNLICNAFRGTLDDLTYGSPTADEVTVDVRPQGGGNWLTGAQTFCAFSINLSANVRITDGQSILGPYYAGPILIGIQKP